MAGLLKKFTISRKKATDKTLQNIQQGVDPETQWKTLGDLGEGSFGMVRKVRVAPTCCNNHPARIWHTTVAIDASLALQRAVCIRSGLSIINCAEFCGSGLRGSLTLRLQVEHKETKVQA